MKRREFVVAGGVFLAAVVSGCLDSSDPTDQNNVSDSVDQNDSDLYTDIYSVDDIIVGGKEEQTLGLIIESNSAVADIKEEFHFEIDVSVLEQYGVDVEQIAVETGQKEGMHPESGAPTVDILDATGGVIDLVVLPPNDSQVVTIDVQLAGFQFTNVETTTGLSYDIQFPDDGRSSDEIRMTESFDLIDPQALPPTLSPGFLIVEESDQSQSLSVEWLTPEDDEVLIEVDLSALDEYGTIEEAGITEEEIHGAVLTEATIDDWIVSMRLVPDSDTSYAAAEISLNGVDVTVADPVEGMSYEMTVEGDAHETVETEPFEIRERERPE